MIFYRVSPSLTTRHILFLCNGDFIKHVRVKLILNTLNKPVRCINTNCSHEANPHWSLPPLCCSPGACEVRTEERSGDRVAECGKICCQERRPKGAPMALPTGRFLAESKYKISNEEERPSLASSLSALMSVSTCEDRTKCLSRCISTRVQTIST